MLENTITVQTDVANNGTPVPEEFRRYEEHLNRSIYIGATHTLSKRDMLSFYRTLPIKAGNFKGVGRAALKSTLDIEVAGVDETTTLTQPILADLAFAIPVGATSADLVKIRQRLVALLDDDTFMTRLCEQLEV